MMLVLAALLWSTSGLFVKSPPLAAILEQDLAGRYWLACRAAGGGGRTGHCSSDRGTCAAGEADAGAVCRLVCVDESVVRHGDDADDVAAAAIFLQYTSTVLGPFCSASSVFHERADRANLVAFGCALAGLTWIVAGDWNTEYFFGNCLALGSGLCYAGVIITLKMLRDEDSAWLVALCHAAAGLVLLPMVLNADAVAGAAAVGVDRSVRRRANGATVRDLCPSVTASADSRCRLAHAAGANSQSAVGLSFLGGIGRHIDLDRRRADCGRVGDSFVAAHACCWACWGGAMRATQTSITLVCVGPVLIKPAVRSKNS